MSTSGVWSAIASQPQPHERLDHSPLALVAAQVHFEDVGDVSRQDARALQNVLGRQAWPEIQGQQLLVGVIGPTGIGQQPPRLAWQIAQPDRTKVVSLNPDSVAMETGSYAGWQDYSQNLTKLIAAVADVIAPTQVRRVGLRYVNQITLPDGHETWDGLIPDHVLGLAAKDSPVAQAIWATEQRVALKVDDEIQCIFRHGLFSDTEGSKKYLLDYDIYRESQRGFDVTEISQTANALHERVWLLFRATVTEDLFKYFS
ncbi:TIGR04255 family protein [Kitasatospora sp. YST-16]|uniref:TIGR04255 family protein n=1 Tax=Kitasatospora sp. YST-16 TaxID=2998080 RepID=UPI002284EC0A|nr:TIGR04255 family protein [Kitasatospora sp. YST-16]WAL72681.1 TIGR04255 family protein [Kitasatospora sp. YST-16]WNW38729.1 TIGR04255 family protein [Streptomyces sp. Li-HN-5-13]